MSARIGVVTFPGSLDDQDARRAVALSGAEPVALWHGSHDLEGVDAVILPGGFSYGDYLRCGAMAAAPFSLPRVGNNELCEGFAAGCCSFCWNATSTM